MAGPGVYWKVLKVSLQTKLEYRGDFLLGVGASLALQAAGLGMMWMVLQHSQGLAGWTGREVALLFGLTTMIQGFSELFFNQVWYVPIHVIGGQIDRLLVYPVKSLPFYLMTSPECHALGNLSGGLLVFGYSAFALDLPLWTFLMMPLWIVCGSLIHTAALVICAAFSFRFLGHRAQHFLIPHTLLQASRYPIDVFPRAMRLILLVFLPFSAANFLPLEWLLRHTTPWNAFLAPMCAASVATWVGFKAWELGLRKYESTGS